MQTGRVAERGADPLELGVFTGYKPLRRNGAEAGAEVDESFLQSSGHRGEG